MQALLSIFIFLNNLLAAGTIEKVSFYTTDSLKVSADLYINNYDLPFVLLFHGVDGSRGEYSEIAKRILKLGYNCLAVDLRVGNKSNFIVNETVERARNQKISKNFIDCKKDIEASIKYSEKFTKAPLILFGSSFSASICLMVSNENKRIKSVIAFSPGEFFRPEIIVKDKIKNLTVPLFISATNLEYEYIVEMLSGISQEYKTIYKPKTGRGLHGSRMLDPSNQTANDCWLELLFFFKKIRNS